MASIEEVISKCVEDIWSEYDKDGNGHLDKEEAKSFVRKTLVEAAGVTDGDFTDADFDACFSEFDKDKSGTIEKEEMAAFIKKVAGL